MPDTSLNLDVKFLKGVGEYRAKLLKKLDITTVGQLMEHFPRTYINRNNRGAIVNLRVGELASAIGTISRVDITSRSKGGKMLAAHVTDGQGGVLLCIWYKIPAWLQKDIVKGNEIWVSGTISSYKHYYKIDHPEYEILSNESSTSNWWHQRQLLPVYPLTGGLTQNMLRNMVYNAFKQYHGLISETLPEHILEQYNWEPRHVALQKVHFATSISQGQQARQRFVFEELFYHQLVLARCQALRPAKKGGHSFELKHTLTTALKNSLPFKLTKAQVRTLNEIVTDMTSSKQMNRLLQGDVGSGKTIITLFALLLAVENNYQAALLAPTEILAEQHYSSIKKLAACLPQLRLGIIKGGTYKGKKKLIEQLKAGEIDIAIGTHALLQKQVKFNNLGLVAIDEQHRFGVEQRSYLATTNDFPDMLYLSATPIPRSLAMTMFGDLDVSLLDELPPGRTPINTKAVPHANRVDVYREIKAQIDIGHQAYVVCPLVEESEKIDLLAAEDLYKEVTEKLLPGVPAALLHGRFKTAQKDEVMQAFAGGDIKILVSTTVIEVGIDVPNASVMVIEHAERFGLSQLHQLRGRVGRGAAKSLCRLIYYQANGQDARTRLAALQNSNDGFEIAEIDLRLRGPGDMVGKAQSGLPRFRHADIVTNAKELALARQTAKQVITEDPSLKLPQHQLIARTYFASWAAKEKLYQY